MSDIDAMQSRIMAALERIGQGLDGLGPLGPDRDEDEVESLRQQLEDEKQTSAYLEERVEQVSEQLQEAKHGLAAARKAEAARAEADAAKDNDDAARAGALKSLDDALQALRQANQQLRDNNAALRAANAKGIADPDLINAAMQAELEGLRASQAADRAEMDVILAELGQMVGNDRTENAPGAGMEGHDV